MGVSCHWKRWVVHGASVRGELFYTMTYAEKLKDPRWQKRRLEVFNRAEFACEYCGIKTATLNVHHRIYRKGVSPWDYADDELQSLCETCHKCAEEDRSHVNETMALMCCEKLIVLVSRAANYEEGIYFGGRLSDAMQELKCLLMFTENMEGHVESLRASSAIPRQRLTSMGKIREVHLAHLENCVAFLRSAIETYHADCDRAIEGKPVIEG